MSNFSYLLSPPPQELHWCGLLCYFHHRHPWLHCSGYCWWVWNAAADNVKHTCFVTTHNPPAQSHITSSCELFWSHGGVEVLIAGSSCSAGSCKAMCLIISGEVKMIHQKQSGAPLMVESLGVLRNAAPLLLFKEVQIPSQRAACIAGCRGGGRVSQFCLVLLSQSSLWLDDQQFLVVIISFKFSWSHLVHSRVTESPLSLVGWAHADLWISPYHPFLSAFLFTFYSSSPLPLSFLFLSNLLPSVCFDFIPLRHF